MKMPFILLNAKNYPAGIGTLLFETLNIVLKVQNESSQRFSVAINTLDLFESSRLFSSEIDIFAQHCDNASFGASTGKIIPDRLLQMGVKGVILNHSENRFDDRDLLLKTVFAAKKAGLMTVVCAETSEEGAFFASHTNADYVAVEPPELIGGDISVSTARPEVIEESVALIGSGKTLIGAGIKNKNDIDIAIQKGASGVLLASGVMKAENILQALKNLL